MSTNRIMDVVLATVGLVLFAPFGILIVLALRVTGEGKVLYRQERIGEGQRPFRVLKFATMLEDSPNIGAGDITEANDPRVLPLGRVLRKTKLNEIPQLANVIRGDMSLVGPRPLTPNNFAYYEPAIRRRIASVRPGITGIGSLVFRDEESILAASGGEALETYRTQIVPQKARLELWYLENRSFGLYVLVLLLTAWVLVFPRSRLPARLLPGLPASSHDRSEAQ